ncbi:MULTISPECIES: CHAP domain-containing protein [unclassified Leucobacter]|uniref:CHAP domain-containing protein n=1 Tax=unclassified Leucobacter TaxID=2621730 RepID=UPI00165E7C1A|nr:MULTISPECIES: CHAP domain-containing protein [unclassified Leucobacter]MBC9937627.1 CHAP domain-containing protein [Leucobacter sp. cx-87]
MRFHTKATILATISSLTLSLGATPAFAASPVAPISTPVAADAVASVHAPRTPQSLVTEIDTAAATPLEAMIEVSSATSAIPHGFNVEQAIAQATAEIGTSRPTGWSQPGECIMSAQRWIRAGGGNWSGGGNPVSNYVTATRIAYDAVQPGDIVQYEYSSDPTAWVTGVHTVLITGVNGDGTFSIIESNNPGGSGLVQAQSNWTPEPPAGFNAAFWRF